MKWMTAVITVLFISFFYVQCTDPCDGVECNNGTCDEGICSCEDGFEGDACDIRKSLKFEGQWEGLFDCVDLAENAIVNIEDDDVDIRKITLNTVGIEMGYDGFTFSLDNTILTGRINQSYTGFFVDTQTMTIEIPNNPGISADVFGSGTLVDDDTLNLLIKVTNEDFGATFSCTGIVDKQ